MQSDTGRNSLCGNVGLYNHYHSPALLCDYEEGNVVTKSKQPQITVTTVYNGKQDIQQIFIDLILKKHQKNICVVNKHLNEYNRGKVFSNVRVT